MLVGVAAGSELIRFREGETVGLDDVGIDIGTAVGSGLVGRLVGTMEV